MHPTPNQSTLPVTHKHMHTQFHQSYTKQEVYSLHPPAKDPYSSKLLPPFMPCPVLHEGLPFCSGLPSSDPVLQQSPVIQWQSKEYTLLLCKSAGHLPTPLIHFFVHAASYAHSTIILTQMKRCTAHCVLQRSPVLHESLPSREVLPSSEALSSTDTIQNTYE